MKTKGRCSAVILRIIFALLLASVLAFFLVGETMMPSENPTEKGSCVAYEADWERVLPDGTREGVKVPGQCSTNRGETVRLESVLSKSQENTWFCMRASQQDMYVYVGDELRKVYTTVETRMFGDNSASAYVFFPIYDEDAGKILAIELISDSEYSGFINKVYTGEKSDIIRELVSQSIGVLAVSLYMLILSTFIVIVGCVLHFAYKKRIDMIYLGIGTLILGCSMTAESNIRQFFIENGSIASHVGLLLTMLIPYPFMVYVSRLQKERYDRFYRSLSWAVMINFLVCSLLQIFGIVDLVDSTIVAHAIIILAVGIMVVTICMDLKNGRAGDYGEVLLGLIAITIAAFWETCITFIPAIPFRGGITLSIALIILLFMATGKTTRELIVLEKEKQVAIEASAAKANFLANMSHEIRTPINTIIGMNEMILRENPGEPVREYANNVTGASKLLLALVNDVLDFSKIESGKLEIMENDYHLSKLIMDAVNGIRTKVESKNLEINVLADETLPSVLRGDEIRIRQILNNLLSNAVKYTKRGSVTLVVDGDFEQDKFVLCISVEDTGVGIKPEDLDKVFDSFQRLEENKHRYIEGTGLGLNITKRLTELMGGSVFVTSKYKCGSCFSVRIPQKIIDKTALGDLKKAYERDYLSKKAETFQLYAPDANMLIVDDNKMNLSVAGALLKRTGITLTFANSGKQCLEFCRKKKFDLILMDHMMPEPDGIETLHMLRQDGESLNGDTDVIVLTANAIVGMKEMYLSKGFSDYLSKPIVAEELESVIARHLPDDKVRLR